MSAVWRCRVCEGVNRGGRTCTTCGATVPPGEPLRSAVRTRMPATEPVAPPPVPPTPTREDLRELPPYEELVMLDPHDLFAGDDRIRVQPMAGGCLFTVPQPRRRRW